jgi:3-keto-5-aminohexanoate cleavage enzyme
VNLPLEQRPEMASLTLGSLNFAGGASLNAPDTIRYLAGEMQANCVKPELEVFDLGMIEFAKVLIGEGLIAPPFYFNIILGNVAGLRADIDHLSFAMQSLPDESIVSVGGIGRTQLHANALGAVAADGVRVGLEDNLWSDWKRKTPATNAGLVERIAAVARAVGREIASPSQVREMLGLRASTAS